MIARSTQGQPAAVLGIVSVVRQLATFALVGTANTAISACVDAALVFTGMPSPLAAAAAFAVGAINGYALNRRWTFDAADSRRARMAYVVVQLSGLVCTVALVSAIDSMALAGHFASYIAATAPVTLATFYANRAWTFSDPRRSGSAGPRACAPRADPRAGRRRARQGPPSDRNA